MLPLFVERALAVLEYAAADAEEASAAEALSSAAAYLRDAAELKARHARELGVAVDGGEYAALVERVARAAAALDPSIGWYLIDE